MPRKNGTDTKLAEIRVRVEERHAENQRRFDGIETTLAAIQHDLHSLLESRSYMRGVWKVVTIVSVLVSGIVTAAIAWVRG